MYLLLVLVLLLLLLFSVCSLGTSPFGKSVDMAEAAHRLMHGHSTHQQHYDTFTDIGSMRTTLEIPPEYAGEEEDDELDDDAMILGTTPKFGSTPRYSHPHGVNPAQSMRQKQLAAGAAAARGGSGGGGGINMQYGDGTFGVGGDSSDDDDDDEAMLGMSPDISGGAPGSFSSLAHVQQQQQQSGAVWASRR